MSLVWSMPMRPPAPVDAGGGGLQSRAARGGAVARWKRQLTWFAASLTVLIVLVPLGSAAAMWFMIGAIARADQVDEQRSRAAVGARMAVLEVDRLLAQTIAEDDPVRARAAAVASIAAASRLEEAVSALHAALPGHPGADEMARVVDSVKEPRVRMIQLARNGARREALQAWQGVAEPLQRIDALSAELLHRQAEQRAEAAQQRFRALLLALLPASLVGAVLGTFFYRRLMGRFRPVEQLLEEVAHSAQELDAGGRQLDTLNGEVQHANRELRALLERFGSSSQAMAQEATACLVDVEQLAQTCGASAGMSRQHADESGLVAAQIQATTQGLHDLLESTRALQQSRSDIVRFADEIQSISATTRLLSLNAAVEAARAGSAGQGFSVIANSVRRLAEDTQQAAVQIRRASEDITRQLHVTADAVQRTSARMDEGAGRIAALDSSARANQALAEGMQRELEGFRASFQHQVDRVRGLDHETQVLADSLETGARHAQLLDETSAALSHTSSALLQRLSNLQARS